MKIRKIRLQGFRLHSDSTLDIGDDSFVVIKGDNFAGKTSIRQGISMCLTPSTAGLDTQGRNFERKIKRGETKAVLTLDVQGGKHLVQRTVTLNTNTSGRTAKCVCLDDPDWRPLPFENFLDRYRDALLVALNTEYFVSMGEKEQKRLLAQLALPSRYDFPEEKTKAVERLLGEGVIDFEGEPFAVIEKAYKKLFDERTTVNRQVKDFHIPDLLPIDPSVDSIGLEKQIEELRSEQRRVQAERDAAVDKIADTEKKRAKLQGTIETIRKDVQQRKEKIDQLDKEILPATDIQELEKQAAHKARHDELVKERNFNNVCIQTKDHELKRFEDLPEAGTTCPTCDQVIDGARLVNMTGELHAARQKYADRNQEITHELNAIGDVDRAIRVLEEQKKKVSEKNTLLKETQEKIQYGKQTRADLDAIGELSDPREAFTGPLAELEKKITDAQNKLRPVIAAEERKQEVTQKNEILDKLKKDAAELDTLVKYFDKDGVKATLLGEYIGGFENKVNEVVSAWGYKVALSIDPYEFLVTTARGDVIPVSELSGGEELMFSLALQCAVSRAAGIGIVVADRMDTFLQPQRKRANACLYKMVADHHLEQVLMIVADTEATAPRQPGFAFFFVADGNVAKL